MKSVSLSLLFVALGVSHALAAEPPAITLRVDNEDGKKVLVATVTADGKPVENVKVAFFARRTFGALALGAEVTLDDGTAADPFPVTLPGDDRGRLRLSAALANRPRDAAPVRAEALFEGGVPFHAESQTAPRALWSSRAPFILLVNIGVLVGLVWAAFAYVVFQLFRIRTEPAADRATEVTGARSVFVQSEKTP